MLSNTFVTISDDNDYNIGDPIVMLVCFFLWVLRNILQYITVNYDILLYIGIDYKITNVFTISFYSTTLSV